jgi:hypothetical protein
MSNEDKDDRYVMGSEDPYCLIRRMLAEQLVRQRAPDWVSATEEDRRWAQEEALKIQRSHEEVARTMFSSKGGASGQPE